MEWEKEKQIRGEYLDFANINEQYKTLFGENSNNRDADL